MTRAEGVGRRAHAESMARVVLRRGARAPVVAHGPRPEPGAGEARVRSLLVGLDGTDDEVLEVERDVFPPGEAEIVLGHECLGEVLSAPVESGLAPGDRVVPLVRHGCGRCHPCSVERSDMCDTGEYREHGIRGLHGFLREEWTDAPSALVKVPAALGDLAVLTEPLSVVVKALEVCSAIQRRVPGFVDFRGARVLLAGTGSLGALAGLALAHEGARVLAVDRSSDESAAARLLRRVGVEHANTKERPIRDLAEDAGGFDLVLEATGSPRVAFDGALALRENGILCLLGVPSEKPAMSLEADDVMRHLVLRNGCVVGSVNSAPRHFAQAAQLLATYRERWGSLLDGLITHRYSPDEAVEAYRADDESLIKKVVDWTHDRASTF